VQVANPTITVGESVEVTIQLRGLQNQPSKARKDYWVWVEVRDHDIAVWKRSVQVKAGTDSERVAIPMERVGVFMIKAAHSELREGAIFVNVRPKSRTPDEAARMRGPGLMPVAWSPPSRTEAQGDVEITVRSSDEGSKLNADGREAAIIQVFVTGALAPFDITLRFFCSRGELQPNPLVIRSGEDHGEIRLTSKERGTASVELIKVDPRGRVKAPQWSKSVQFLQPITGAHVLPTRSEMSLIEPTEDVKVELLGLDHTATKPDEPIQVTVAVSASGEINPDILTLTPDEPVKSVQFAPRQHGRAVITATPFGAESGQGIIYVVVPWASLVAIIAGGFLGGLGSLLGKRFKGLAPLGLRGLLGAFTALVFYWTIQSGLVHISPSTVRNSLYALLGSLLAGYLGTKLIDVIWQSVSKTA
jgi:hypothetical protein